MSSLYSIPAEKTFKTLIKHLCRLQETFIRHRCDFNNILMISIPTKTRRPASICIFLAQLKFSTNLCIQLKNEKTALSLVFKGFSTHINSTTDFYNSWHYRITRPPKQSCNPEVLFWIPFSKMKISCEILIVEIQTVFLEKVSLTIEKSHFKKLLF